MHIGYVDIRLREDGLASFNFVSNADAKSKVAIS